MIRTDRSEEYDEDRAGGHGEDMKVREGRKVHYEGKGRGDESGVLSEKVIQRRTTRSVSDRAGVDEVSKTD